MILNLTSILASAAIHVPDSGSSAMLLGATVVSIGLIARAITNRRK